MMPRPLSSLSSLAAALLLAMGSCAALAAEDNNSRWYQVEVIVFSYADTSKRHETWRSSGISSDLPFAAELLYPAEIPTTKVDSNTASTTPALRHVRAIYPDKSTLKEEAERIAASPDYHLLVHKGWVQVVDRNIDPTPVVIDDLLPPPQITALPDKNQALWELPVIAGKNRSLPLGAQPSADAEQLLRQALAAEELDEGIVIESAASDPVLDSIPVVRLGPPVQLVFGTVGIKWSRYLHLMVDITYRRDPKLGKNNFLASNTVGMPEFTLSEEEVLDPPEAPAPIIKDDNKRGIMPEVVDFRIADSQRLRRNQIYYFDHPLFGVLAKVSNYDPPASEQTALGAGTPKANPSGALGGR